MATESVSEEPQKDVGLREYIQWWKGVSIGVLSLTGGLLTSGTLGYRMGTIVGTAPVLILVFVIGTAIYRVGGSVIQRAYSYPALMRGRKWMAVCLFSTVLAVPISFVLVGVGGTANPAATFVVLYLYIGLFVAIVTVAFRGVRRGYAHVTSRIEE